MAGSGAAGSILQRALQNCLSASRPTFSPLLPQTQVRHATRATIARNKAKAEALARSLDPNAPKPGPSKAPRSRPNRDHNKLRGVSAMRRTGPRETLSVSGLPLPRPVSPEEFPVIETDPNHGLWGFFYSNRKALNTPDEDIAHGRAWTVEELRRKSWEDLHALWWVCSRERNRIATGNVERRKGEYGYGAAESRAREIQVRKTQNAIKHALTERFYAWEDAVKVAKEDPSYKFEANSVRNQTATSVRDPSVDSRDSSADDLEWDDDVWVEEDEGRKKYPLEQRAA